MPNAPCSFISWARSVSILRLFHIRRMSGRWEFVVLFPRMPYNIRQEYHLLISVCIVLPKEGMLICNQLSGHLRAVFVRITVAYRSVALETYEGWSNEEFYGFSTVSMNHESSLLLQEYHYDET